MSKPVTSSRNVALVTIGAALVAATILVSLVLPAEYGIDPLGTGKALGLLGLSRQEPEAVTEQARAFALDRVSFELGPFESVEYKYRLEAGASLLFGWEASAETVFDFHAEPDGAAAGFAESFSQGRATADNGLYVAQFPGIHGWFFENRQSAPLTVTLITAGFYSGAIEFRDGWETPRQPPSAAEVLAQ